MPKKKTHDEFLVDLNNRNNTYPNKKVHLLEGEKYINAHTKLKFRCNSGHIWEAPPVRIIQGKWCPVCSRKDVGNQNLTTHEIFLKRIKKRNSDFPNKPVKLIEGQSYRGIDSKLKWKCKNNHTWEAIPKSIIRGSYCPECKRLNNIDLHTNSFLLENKDWLISEHHDQEKTLSQIAQELKSTPDTIGKYFKHHEIEIKNFTHSQQEKEVNDFLVSLGVETKQRIKNIIPPYELDIYVPSHNIAIEYCGLYWHSDVHERIDKFYHQRKMMLCKNEGIRLITIFGDEWMIQQQKVKDTLAHFLGKSEKGVFGRKVTIREIPFSTSKPFLDQYHLLHSGKPGKYRIGAFGPSGNLVGVMVFGNRCSEGSSNVIELKRFVTDKKNNPGLGSKMFKWAIKNYSLSEIIAFVDLRWFDGEVKNKIGFKQIGVTSPTFYWTKNERRFNRTFITKQKLKNMKLFENQDLTKKEMMRTLGYHMIWDCGKMKLIWNN